MYVKFAYDRELGGRKYRAGDVIETDYNIGSVLISRGLAVKTRKPAKQEPEKVTEPVKATEPQEPKVSDSKNSKGESN